MAIDILRNPNYLAESTTRGIDSLIEGKLKGLQHQRKEEALERVGIPKQFASLSDAALVSYMNNQAKERSQLLKQNYAQQQQQQFENNLYGIQSQEQQAIQGNQPQALPFQGIPQQQVNDNQLDNMLGRQTDTAQLSAMSSLIPSPPSQERLNQPNKPTQNNPIAPLSKPIPRGLTPAQYNQVINQRQREQASVNSSNAQFLTGFTKAMTNAETSLDILNQMEQLLSTGKVFSGLKGQIRPTFTQNDETQLFDKLSNQLAQTLAGQSGVATGFKIKFAQLQKPNINQNRGTQLRLINSMQREAEEVLRKGTIKDDIINENGGYQPPNLEVLVHNRIKELEKNPKEATNKNISPSNQSNIDENESLLGTGLRYGISGASRLANLGIGTLSGANLASLPVDLLHAATSRVPEEQLVATNKKNVSPEVEASRKVFRNLQEGSNRAKLYIPQTPSWERLQEIFPPLKLFKTSSQLDEAIDHYTSGYTKEQSPVQSFINGAVKTAASLFMPTALRGPYAQNMARYLGPEKATKLTNLILPYSGASIPSALAKGALAETTGTAASLLGGGSYSQAFTKLTTLALADMYGTKTAFKSGMQENFEQAENYFDKRKLSPNDVVPIEPILKSVKKLKERVLGGGDPHMESVLEAINAVENSLSSGGKKAARQKFTSNVEALKELKKNKIPKDWYKDKIPVQTLLQSKIDNNKWYGLAANPKVPGQRHLPYDARTYIGELNDIISKPIDAYGLKHEEFGKPWALAQDKFKALKDSNGIKDFLEQHASSTVGFKSAPAKVALLGTSAIGLQKVAEIYNFITNHPIAREAYVDAMKSALENNLPAFIEAMSRLDKEGEKY